MSDPYDAIAAKLDALAPEVDDDHHRNAPIPEPACLYGLIGEIAAAGSATTEANPFAIALNALVYLGCCLGRGPYLPVGNTWHHPRLFGLHVGRSSRGRKGDALALLHRIDMALRNLNVTLAPQVHRGGLSSREGLILLIHDGFKEGQNEVGPIHDKRLWVVESEFANVLHQTKREGNTLSAALRDCWDGISLKPATKSNRIATTDPHVALSAAVTPTELLALIETKELTNGFANRFLAIYSERTRLVPMPKGTPQAEVDQLAARVAEVLKYVQADRWVERDHMRMTLSPESEALYESLYRTELNRDDYGPLVTAILERRPPTLLRIAMLLALTDQTTVIAPAHIRAALAWVRYWTDSVRYIFASGAQEQAQRATAEAAEKIVAYLDRHGRQSRSAMNRECFHGKLPKAQIDAALDKLLAETPPRVVVEVEPRRDGPGSPTKYYKLLTKSAKSADRDERRRFAGDCGPAQSGEVSEISDQAADAVRPDFATVRQSSPRLGGAERHASAEISLNPLISPAIASDDAERLL